MLRVQRLVPRIAPRLLAPALRATEAKRFVDWSFNHYLNLAHPSFAQTDGVPARSRRTAAAGSPAPDRRDRELADASAAAHRPPV